MEKFGYIRVSTKDQNEARQREKMVSLGVADRFLFTEKQSGKDFDRPIYTGDVPDAPCWGPSVVPEFIGASGRGGVWKIHTE